MTQTRTVYAIELTREQLQYLASVLGRMPYAEVRGVVETIEGQIIARDQQDAAEAAALQRLNQQMQGG